MTQSPLGTNQGGSGPFDEAGPGQPDVATSEFTAAPEPSTDVPAATPGDAVGYGDRALPRHDRPRQHLRHIGHRVEG